MAKRSPIAKIGPAAQAPKARPVISWIAKHLFYCILGGSALATLLTTRAWEWYNTPCIVVEIMRPISDPKDHNYEVQIIIIENIGKRHADSVKVAIPYPSINGVTNVSFSYPQTIDVTNIRSVHDQLAFDIASLPLNHRVIIALNASVNTVRPQGVDITYKDGILDPKNILFNK